MNDLPTRTRGENTRQRILETAITTFSSHGYAGGTLDAIAKELGVTRQTILFHFGDKAGLYNAALEHLFSERQDAMQIRQREDFAELGDYVDYLVVSAVSYYLSHPEFPRMLVHFMLALDPVVKEAQPEVVAMVSRWQEVVDECESSGITRKVFLPSLIAQVSGTLSYYFLIPGAAQTGEKLLDYDPRNPENLDRLIHDLQASIRGMLTL